MTYLLQSGGALAVGLMLLSSGSARAEEPSLVPRLAPQPGPSAPPEEPTEPLAAEEPPEPAEPTTAEEPAKSVEATGASSEEPEAATNPAKPQPAPVPGLSPPLASPSSPKAAPTPLPPTVSAPSQQVSPPKTEVKPVAESSPSSPRFRFGVQTGHGPLFEKRNTFLYTGTEARAGVELMDTLGLYLVPRAAFFIGGGDTEAGIGHLLGISAGADWTFGDRYFVGAGIGIAELTKPRMLDVSLRVGRYLLMNRSDSARRHGTFFVLDVHHYRGSYYRIYSPTLSFGYEAF